MSACPHCGSVVPKNQKFCGNCGKSIENNSTPNSMQSDNSNLQLCPDCNKEVSRNASKCPHCGSPFRKPFFKRDNIRSYGILIIIVVLFQAISFVTFDRINWKFSLSMSVLSYLIPLLIIFYNKLGRKPTPKYFPVAIIFLFIGLLGSTTSVEYNFHKKRSFIDKIDSQIERFWSDNTVFCGGYTYGLTKDPYESLNLYRFETPPTWNNKVYFYEMLHEHGLNAERDVDIHLTNFRRVCDITRERFYPNSFKWSDKIYYMFCSINYETITLNKNERMVPINKDCKKIKKIIRDLGL